MTVYTFYGMDIDREKPKLFDLNTGDIINNIIYQGRFINFPYIISCIPNNEKGYYELGKLAQTLFNYKPLSEKSYIHLGKVIKDIHKKCEKLKINPRGRNTPFVKYYMKYKLTPKDFFELATNTGLSDTIYKEMRKNITLDHFVYHLSKYDEILKLTYDTLRNKGYYLSLDEERQILRKTYLYLKGLKDIIRVTKTDISALICKSEFVTVYVGASHPFELLSLYKRKLLQDRELLRGCCKSFKHRRKQRKEYANIIATLRYIYQEITSILRNIPCANTIPFCKTHKIERFQPYYIQNSPLARYMDTKIFL